MVGLYEHDIEPSGSITQNFFTTCTATSS